MFSLKALLLEMVANVRCTVQTLARLCVEKHAFLLLVKLMGALKWLANGHIVNMSLIGGEEHN